MRSQYGWKCLGCPIQLGIFLEKSYRHKLPKIKLKLAKIAGSNHAQFVEATTAPAPLLSMTAAFLATIPLSNSV